MKKKSSIHISEKKSDEIVIQERETPSLSDKNFKKSSSRFTLYKVLLLLISGLLLLVPAAFYLWWPKELESTSTEGELKIEKTIENFVPQVEGWEHSTQQIVLEEDMLSLISGNGWKYVLDWQTVLQIEQIMAWSVGLSNMQKGDTIRLIWESPIIASLPDLNKKRILAMSFKTNSLDTSLFAFAFETGVNRSFYDQEGVPWKRQFLSSPVRYGKVSSPFNLSRLHPVLKKIKPHRGVDFAALEGDEVLALAKGTVEKIDYDRYNGNYISLRHPPDSIYSTIYLHLQRSFPGLKEGTQVDQGQVIGYVGQTGLATGPHVCLRFKRRDYQDDFLEVFPYLPKPNAIDGILALSFYAHRDSLIQKLANHIH